MARHKINCREGDWFALPLRDGDYVVGVVARMDGDGGVVGYVCGPRRAEVPSLAEVENLDPDQALRLLRFRDLGLIEHEWPIIGRSKTWDRERWPRPDVGAIEGPYTDRAWRVHYSESDLAVPEHQGPDVIACGQHQRACQLDTISSGEHERLSGRGDSFTSPAAHRRPDEVFTSDDETLRWGRRQPPGSVMGNRQATLLLHPVRLRILQTARGRWVTTTFLAGVTQAFRGYQSSPASTPPGTGSDTARSPCAPTRRNSRR